MNQDLGGIFPGKLYKIFLLCLLSCRTSIRGHFCKKYSEFVTLPNAPNDIQFFLKHPSEPLILVTLITIQSSDTQFYIIVSYFMKA